VEYDPDEMDGGDLDIAPHDVPEAPPVPSTPAGEGDD
jgi:hypothetical protein